MALAAARAKELLAKLNGETEKRSGGGAQKAEEGEWEDGDGEWEYDDDGEDGEWEYDDPGSRAVEEYDGESGGMMQIRPQMGGRNRMRNVGLHTIEIYYPQFYFKQTEMEEFDARPDRYGPSVIGKYTKGIGQIEARFCSDDEDPISFAMTVTHRLVDRMESEGFNETYKYSEDGSMLNGWNAIGRLDIGSESLVDRSKSMKAYVMDLFERYGDGESNIEGVDMYNACYGGQAAGLCAQNWVESDRWDGRYGLAIATDISDAPYQALAFVGAACTGALYFPDAPLPHHSHRASCILHRFDFFKPVGWFHMGPVVDGKYSIDAYMNAVDTCYHTLRRKMNDRPLLEITDYNVFHTGGGYHVVKKAFERCIRAENPRTPAEIREQYVQKKLLPGVHLLKLIGPCHTVSSFLNISSVIMGQWDQALGKILLVFTYGSGCASSMYQLRFDDLCWMDPLGIWKVRQFYREAIHSKCDTTLHQAYIDTWMKFDYRPQGRKLHGYGYETLELDAYYLMEIDAWGRRFYHRGGMRSGPLKKKNQNETALHYDTVENRTLRESLGDLPAGPFHQRKIEDSTAKKEPTLEDKWRAIDNEMTFEDEVGAMAQEKIIDEKFDRNNEHKLVVVEKRSSFSSKDSLEHSYQIVGTWTGMKFAEEMRKTNAGSYVFEVMLSFNRWDQFFLIQDNDWNKKIYPANSRSYKDLPCGGPHKGPADPQYWLINGNPSEDLPDEDEGNAGDKYLVTFSWDSLKRLTWQKQSSSPSSFYEDDGRYFVSGSWNCWETEEMVPDSTHPGRHHLQVQKTSEGLRFNILRNEDHIQCIYPLVDAGTGNIYSKVAPIGEFGTDRHWDVGGDTGDVFRIILDRNPHDPDDIAVSWKIIDRKPIEAPSKTRYFLVGAHNRWGKENKSYELTYRSAAKSFVCEVPIVAVPAEFQIWENKHADAVLHPNKKACLQESAHEVLGPDDEGPEYCWSIDADSDMAKLGDTFVVNVVLEPRRMVSWSKRD